MIFGGKYRIILIVCDDKFRGQLLVYWLDLIVLEKIKYDGLAGGTKKGVLKNGTICVD